MSKAKNSGDRSRNWVFTLNNPDTKGYVSIDLDGEESYDLDYDGQAWKSMLLKATFVVCQLEKGEENKTLHLQGYVEFSNALRLSSVRNMLNGAHWEVRRGTQAEAIAYSTKPETRVCGPWQWGQKGQQGSRSDLDEVVSMVEEGKELYDIVVSNPKTLKYISHIEKLISLQRSKPRGEPRIIWLYGDSGTGKSRCAWEVLPDAYLFQENENGPQWWDGYRGEKGVILDEFQGKYPFRQILQLFDRYQLRVQVKGSSRAVHASHFIVTSNEPPEDFYAHQFDKRPLRRRLEDWACIAHFRRRDGERGVGISSTYIQWRQRYRYGDGASEEENEEIDYEECVSRCKQFFEN
jgi:hypothetical protein